MKKKIIGIILLIILILTGCDNEADDIKDKENTLSFFSVAAKKVVRENAEAIMNEDVETLFSGFSKANKTGVWEKQKKEVQNMFETYDLDVDVRYVIPMDFENSDHFRVKTAYIVTDRTGNDSFNPYGLFLVFEFVYEEGRYKIKSSNVYDMIYVKENADEEIIEGPLDYLYQTGGFENEI